jgi:hypothetical protein
VCCTDARHQSFTSTCYFNLLTHYIYFNLLLQLVSSLYIFCWFGTFDDTILTHTLPHSVQLPGGTCCVLDHHGMRQASLRIFQLVAHSSFCRGQWCCPGVDITDGIMDGIFESRHRISAVLVSSGVISARSCGYPVLLF